MKLRSLGRTGLQVSEICLGTMTFGVQCDEATSRAILDRAAAGGVNFIDTADCYPIPLSLETVGLTEEIIGRWLGGRRSEFVLATKCFFPTGPGPDDRGASRRHVTEALEASLRRLRTDHIDLYQLHAFDAQTPLEETLRALDDAVRSGKVRHVGCSNYLAWELAKALLVSERDGLVRYQCVQPRYNLLHRDADLDLLPLCRDQGLGVIAFNPLAGGLLTGKHRFEEPAGTDTRFGPRLGSTGESYRKRYWHQESFQLVEGIKARFEPTGRRLPSVAVAWVLAQPGITSAIVGASSPAQLDDTLAGADLVLAPDELKDLDQAWYDLPRRPALGGPVR
jgi:aryl-alcohol dehydrogenase-like predicted oxidoreductase